MFHSELIIPKVIRNNKNDLITTTEVINTEFENDVILMCGKDKFYQLLKNEPKLYISLIEKDQNIRDHVKINYHFSLERQANGQLVFNFNIKDEYPIVLSADMESETPDSDLIEDLQQYIIAKEKEQYLPKVKKYSDVRKKTREPPINSKDSDLTLQYLNQIELLIQKIRKLY